MPPSRLLKSQLATAASLVLAPKSPTAPAKKRTTAARRKKKRAPPPSAPSRSLDGYWQATVNGKAAAEAKKAAARALGI